MMSLAAWLERKQTTQAELARTLGCSEPHMSMIVRGKRTPSLPLAERIVKATGGQVAVMSLIAGERG